MTDAALLGCVDTVLFDLDGTIIDTHELILTSMRYTINNFAGKNVSDAELMAKVGQPLATQMADYASSDDTIETLLKVYREHNAIHHDELARDFKGTSATLRALRDAGYLLGIVTSKRHDVALRGLRLFGLEEFFPHVVGADDVDAHKPDPAPVIYGAKLLGRSPETCLYVGDSPFDIMAGNAAGCVTVAALWGMFPAQTLVDTSPDFLCSDITELTELLGVPTAAPTASTATPAVPTAAPAQQN